MANTTLEIRAVAAARRGDLEPLFAAADGFRPQLERAVRLRMDAHLRSRLSASDVLQETLVHVSERLPDYLAQPEQVTAGGRGRMPLFLWLRFLALQTLRQKYRRHVGAAQRDARRDVPLELRPEDRASAVVIADWLTHSGTTPSGVVSRAEQRELVLAALDALDPIDREVLVMRHFEQLSNNEIATALDLTPSGATCRHVRALERLRSALVAAGVPLSFPGT